MTMTSVAVAQGSLGAPSVMLSPNMYHLQQGLNPNSTSPAPGKSHDTLDKGGKKSWSVKLGLSRQSQHTDSNGKNWGSMGNGSVLSRQLVYGEPWLYGTVRLNRPGAEYRAFLSTPPGQQNVPSSAILPGSPVLVLCSCPEFLNGTTRKVGNCRRCGGHRWVGMPLGGTCRLPSSSICRPSLAGILRVSMDDPYDRMRRNRLLEPRSRARSISPRRLSPRRDLWNETISRSTDKGDDLEAFVDNLPSNLDWYPKSESSATTTAVTALTTSAVTLSTLNTTTPAISMMASLNSPNVTSTCATTVITSEIGQTNGSLTSSDYWHQSKNTTSNNHSQRLNVPKYEHSANVNTQDLKKVNVKLDKAGDTRKSILECDVNPYLLLRKRIKDEDDLSDELSDNALEKEESPSSFILFDPSKVRLIEKMQTRNTVAAISGQRVKVFNDRREDVSDDEELIPITRVPIPKISPKRPPRRLKVTAKQTLKSILKGGVNEKLRDKELGRGKSVLFNVGNVIFAPEKPTDSTWLSWNSISCETTSYEKRKKQPFFTSMQSAADNEKGEREKVQRNEPASQSAKHKFITIPNIQNTRINKDIIKVPREIKSKSSSEGIMSDRPVISGRNKFRTGAATLRQARTFDKCTPVTNRVSLRLQIQKQLSNTQRQNSINIVKGYKPKIQTDLKTMIKEMNFGLTPNLSMDEKDLILKCKDRTRCSRLIRSRSDLSLYQRDVPSTDDVFFRDTMRISVFRKKNDISLFRFLQSSPSSFADTLQIATESEDEIAKCLPTESNSAANLAINTSDLFQKMRPTNWSPPPERQKQRYSVCYSTNDKIQLENSMSTSDSETSQVEKLVQYSNTSFARGTESPKLSTLCRNKITKQRFLNAENLSSDNNVCKITVSPQTSPLVHRLNIGSDVRGTKRTSITINGDPANHNDTTSNNKVTISVGGEDSACNPTVISINNSSPPRSQNLTENRTLVILGNYRSNIIVEPPNENNSDNTKTDNNNEQSTCDGCVQGDKLKQLGLHHARNPPWIDEGTSPHSKDRPRVQHLQWRVYDSPGNGNLDEKQNRLDHINGNNATREESNEHLSKEAVISKLLEDSLKKAKENGEILSEGNGEAIIKILKQSLLKDKEFSKFSGISSTSGESKNNADTPELIPTSIYLEENPYEIIKEPIYEEIPDEQPPPLPLSPPPSSDYFKDRMYFGELDFYKPSSYTFSNAACNKGAFNDFMDPYNTKTSDDFLKKLPKLRNDEDTSTTFKLFNFLLDSKEQPTALLAEDEDDEEDGDDADVDEDEDIEEEEDTERDLEALYEQKETSLGDLSSKSSQISNVSDSSEECNIILTSSSNVLKEKSADIERTDSGVGSESSQTSSSRGVARRWRSSHISTSASSIVGTIPQIISTDAKLCEDCEQRLEPLVTDSGVVYAPFVCRKCSKKRAERKEIITEIVETEQKYGRDLKIILEEFHRPMLRAGLLTSEQLLAIFLNVEELLEHNLVLAEKLTDAVERAQKSGDEDLLTVDVGKIFLESERMLHAFESYCTRQGSASLLLQNLEKEKELLRIFLKVSQMENTVLRRMNLNSFLMVPVQRVTKYPLLLARLLKATPSIRADIHEAKKKLKQAQTNIELHLEHMNAEAKDITSTKLWRRISIIQNGRRTIGEQDMVNIKLRKMAVEVLEWPHEEARFVLEGRLLVAQPTDNNWRRGRTIKLVPVTAVLVTNGKPCAEYRQFPDDSLFSRHIGVKEATLLLVKEKLGRCTLLREPLYLDKCIVYCETDLEDYFEIQELSSKETFIFKAEDGSRTKKWCRTLQIHAQSLGAWRKRRGALPNIMICGVTRN